MRQRLLPLLCACCLLLPVAAATAQQHVEYSYAQLYAPNSTVDLIPNTLVSGYLCGIKCNFTGSTSIRVEFTIDGNASSFLIDPTHLPQESSGAGQYLTDWIPFFSPVGYLHVQLNNTGLGFSTVNCWAVWMH